MLECCHTMVNVILNRVALNKFVLINITFAELSFEHALARFSHAPKARTRLRVKQRSERSRSVTASGFAPSARARHPALCIMVSGNKVRIALRTVFLVSQRPAAARRRRLIC